MRDGLNAVVAVLGDGSTRDHLSRSLEGMGFHIREAASGERVLQLASEGASLIALGGNPPDMDVVEFVRRLKAGPPTTSIPLVLLRVAGSHEAPTLGVDVVSDYPRAHPIGSEIEAVRLAALGGLSLWGRDRAGVWQSALDRMGDGICILDREGRVVRCNRPLPTLLGRPDEVLDGRELAGLIEEEKVQG